MKLMHLTLSAALAGALLAGCAGTPSQQAHTGHAAAAANDTPTRSADGTLIDPHGKTLYTFAKDTKNSGASECYEQCAVNWPPLIAAEGAKPMGDYTLIIRNDGKRQWAFKGMPLYTFHKDAKAGDKSGDGLANGAWKVARP